MQKINSETSLREAIIQMENRQAFEGKLLRDDFHLAYESVKPINLIKNTLKEAVHSQDLKDNIINTSLGLTAGYLSRMLFVGASAGPVKKILGAALLFGITNLVAKNPEVIKSVGRGILNLIRSKSGAKKNGTDTHPDETGETAS